MVRNSRQKFCLIAKKTLKSMSTGALVQWLWEETRVPKVVSSNPCTVYWLDIFQFVVKIVMCVRKDKKNEKQDGLFPFLKEVWTRFH